MPARRETSVLHSPKQAWRFEIMTPMTTEERLELTRGVLAMLDEWEINDRDQLALLGLGEAPVRELRQLREHRALPDEPEVMQRIEHLINIADALRTTYPFSRRMGKLWMHKPNRKFRQRTPVATMVEDGIVGLISVRSYLDCTFSWDQSGSTG
jgi:hypothetical protein